MDKLLEIVNIEDIPKEASHFKIVNGKTVIFYRNVYQGTHDKKSMYDFEWYTYRNSAPSDIKELTL